MTDFRQKALDYHEFPVPGKTAVTLTKPAETSMDLALAYSPGWQSRYVKSLPILPMRTDTPTRATRLP